MARNFAGGTDKIAYTAFTPDSVVNTISIWFYQTAAQIASHYYVIADNATGSPHWGFLSGAAGGANKIAYYFSASGIDPGTNTFSNNAWNHVAAVLSGSGVNVQAYLNGVADGSLSAAGSWVSSAITMNLGNNGANAAFAGSEADLAIWKGVALSAAEIGALAAGARPHTIRPSSLQIYSPLNGAASPEPDLSGKANNGTLTGTANASGPPLMQFTPRWPQFLTPPAAASSVVFRKTLSQVGGRVGTRQIQGWAN